MFKLRAGLGLSWKSFDFQVASYFGTCPASRPVIMATTIATCLAALSDNDSYKNRWWQGAIPGLIMNAVYLKHLKEGAYARSLGTSQPPGI